MELVDLGQEKYVSLTTFKRDGTPVSTPVWVVREDGRLLVWSAADTWKVKRIRRDGHVRVAGCSGLGKLHGTPVEAEASIVTDTTLVQRLIARKYGLVYRVIHGFGIVSRWLRRKPTPEAVTIAIVPPSAPPGPAA